LRELQQSLLILALRNFGIRSASPRGEVAVTRPRRLFTKNTTTATLQGR
jgi:hypothetical protein